MFLGLLHGIPKTTLNLFLSPFAKGFFEEAKQNLPATKEVLSYVGLEIFRVLEKVLTEENPFRGVLIDSLLAFMCFSGVRIVLRVSKFLIDALLSAGTYICTLGSGFKSRNHLRSQKYRLGAPLRSYWVNGAVFYFDLFLSVGQSLAIMVFGTSLGCSLLRFNDTDKLLTVLLRASLSPISVFNGILSAPRFWFFQFPLFLAGFGLYRILERKRVGAKIIVTTVINNYNQTGERVPGVHKKSFDLAMQAIALDDALGWTEFWRDIRDRLLVVFRDCREWRRLFPRRAPSVAPIQFFVSSVLLLPLIFCHALVCRDPTRRAHLSTVLPMFVRSSPVAAGDERPIMDDRYVPPPSTSEEAVALSTPRVVGRELFPPYMGTSDVNTLLRSLLPGTDTFCARYGSRDFTFLGLLPFEMRPAPYKPVQNNQYFINFLHLLDADTATGLIKLTRVPPTPFRAAVEMFKFIKRPCFDFSLPISRDPSRRTYREMMHEIMSVWIGDRVVDHLNPDNVTLEFYSAESQKHHPGLLMRQKGIHTKREAFPQSQKIAMDVYKEMLCGNFDELKKHIWLSLPVVKKQATRKADIEMRARMAVIPDMWQDFLWKGFLPFFKDLEDPFNKTPLSRFDLFHGGLNRKWKKFCNNIQGTVEGFVLEQLDIKDHGASIQVEVFEFLSEVLAKRNRINGVMNQEFVTALFMEICYSKIAFQIDDSGSWGVIETKAGLNDGNSWTTNIDGLALLTVFAFTIVHWYALGKIDNVSSVARRLIMETHGDNSLRAIPVDLQLLTFRDTECLQFMADLGFQIKPDESNLSTDFSVKEVGNFTRMEMMSWHLSKLRSGRSILKSTVGWRHPVDALKGLAYPEKIMEMDRVRISDLEYQADVVTSLYILHYWNPVTRAILQCYWEFLQDLAQAECGLIRVDFTNLKKKFDRIGVVRNLIDFPIVSLGDPTPFPLKRLIELWQGPEFNPESFLDLEAAHIPSDYCEARASRICANWQRARETGYSSTAVDLPSIVAVSCENDLPYFSLRFWDHLYRTDSYFDLCYLTPVCEELFRRLPIVGPYVHWFIIFWEAFCDYHKGRYLSMLSRVVVHNILYAQPFLSAVLQHSGMNHIAYTINNVQFHMRINAPDQNGIHWNRERYHVSHGYIWAFLTGTCPEPVSTPPPIDQSYEVVDNWFVYFIRSLFGLDVQSKEVAAQQGYSVWFDALSLIFGPSFREWNWNIPFWKKVSRSDPDSIAYGFPYGVPSRPSFPTVTWRFPRPNCFGIISRVLSYVIGLFHRIRTFLSPPR